MVFLVDHLVEARRVEEPVDVVEDELAGDDAEGDLPGHFSPKTGRVSGDVKTGAAAGADGEGGEG